MPLKTCRSLFLRANCQNQACKSLLEQIITYLKDSQAGFRALYQQALETEAGKEIITSATKLKKGTLAKLKSVAEYLNAVAKSKPDIYGTIQAEMAELINNVNHKIRLRRDKPED